MAIGCKNAVFPAEARINRYTSSSYSLPFDTNSESGITSMGNASIQSSTESCLNVNLYYFSQNSVSGDEEVWRAGPDGPPELDFGQPPAPGTRGIFRYNLNEKIAARLSNGGPQLLAGITEDNRIIGADWDSDTSTEIVSAMDTTTGTITRPGTITGLTCTGAEYTRLVRNLRRCNESGLSGTAQLSQAKFSSYPDGEL